MRIETIKKTYKTFEELTEEQQQKVLDNNRYINVEFEDFDYLIEDFFQTLKEKTDLELNYKDLIYSISDYGRDNHLGIYSKNLVNQLINRFEDKGLYDISTTDKLGSYTNHLGGGICSKGSTEQDLAKCYFEDDTNEKTQEEITKKVNDIINIVIDLCSEYYDKFVKDYNYYLSDESIKETILANKMDFDIDDL